MLIEAKLMKSMTKYEFGEKSNKFFLNVLEKRRPTQKIVWRVVSNEQETTDLFKINTHIYQFYQHLHNEKMHIYLYLHKNYFLS